MFWPKTSDVAEPFFLITIPSPIAQHEPIMIGRRYQSRSMISSLRVASDQLHLKTAPKLAVSFKVTNRHKKKTIYLEALGHFYLSNLKIITPVMMKHFDFHSFLIHLVGGEKKPHKHLQHSTSNHPLLSLWLVWEFLTRGITSTVEAAMAAALAFSASSYVGSEVATL